MIELMVVVIIISVVAALTIPNITRRMRERRSGEAAHRVMLLYQEARMTAMGRGTAVLVRYNHPGVDESSLDVLIGQAGNLAAAGCQQLPIPSCTAIDWNIAAAQQFRPLTSFDPDDSGLYDRVTIEMHSPSDTPSFLDVCFTPMGRTFVRQSQYVGFSEMTGVYRADVFRNEGGTKIGRTRSVTILPNGAARLQ